MALRLRYFAFGVLALLAPTGCQLLDEPVQGRSPLAAATPSPDSIALEVFFARFPANDAQINGPLWSEIDEQHLSPELRRALAENGFRAGLIGAHLPAELARLLKLSDKPQAPEERRQARLDADPTVTLRVLQTRSGRRNEVVTSSVYDELPLLTRDEGQVRGRTYHNAEGRFALRAFPETEGRVRLELLPELHHGEPQTRWAGTDGVMRLEAGRPKQAFDDLRIKTLLAPGQMLLLTSRVDRPGSLGHYFFTDPAGDAPTQKLLIVRLAQNSSDGLFNDDVKPIDLSIP